MKCHQRIIRETAPPEPDEEIKRELARDFTHASVREVDYATAKELIVRYEWLRSMGSARWCFALYFGEFIGGVCCFGSTVGTRTFESIAGIENAPHVCTLVRGCCLPWTPVYSASYLISEACDQMSKKYGKHLFVGYATEEAGEVGQIYSSLDWIYTGKTNPAEVFSLDGRIYDSKQVSNMARDFRTRGRGEPTKFLRSRDEQRKLLLERGAMFHPGFSKHRFVGLYGSRGMVKRLKKALKLPSLPFPRREAVLPVSVRLDPEQTAGPVTDLQGMTIATIEASKPAASEQLVTIEPVTPSIGLPGCTYIYAPKGQAGEYAPLAANPYRGCGHGCSYCYVPLMLKMKRPEFDAGANARPDFLKHLAKDARKYKAAGITEQVFFSFTTDVYSPFDRSLTRPSLQLVQEHGMGICVLTKGGTRALADIDLYRPDRDCFACTLTSLDASFQKKWERNAAPPDDRLVALKAFHERGIFTWVSLEPTLDVESSLAIVGATHGFVDLYKIGRANYLGEYTRTTDWRDYTLRMIDLCQRLVVTHYIKRDLQPYLPAGYDNPMRVRQHF